MNTFTIYRTARGDWRWTFGPDAGTVVAKSGEGFDSKAGARVAVDAVKAAALDAKVYDADGALLDADSARQETPQTAPPRVWVLPSIPEDVKAVRDRTGIVWRRKGPMDGGWFSPGTGAWWFAEILRSFGPLTEVPDA